MNEIQLLAVGNVVSRRGKSFRQTLSFLLSVENLGYVKTVDVLWAGADGVWRSLPAGHAGPHGDRREYWRAQATMRENTELALPGSIRFAVRFRCGGAEYWDNNGGNDFSSLAGSGTTLGNTVAVQNIGFESHLQAGQQVVPVYIAVNPNLRADRVVIHWTLDDWQHTRQTPCRLATQGRERGVQVWAAPLPVGNAFRLAYRICCESWDEDIRDDNAGADYRASRAPLKVLVLNLHCYQEAEQDRKFSQIARAIDEQAVDVVCFQEVAEHWNNGYGDRDSNSAHIINQRLQQPMHLYTDWSHRGFDRYREGVAILSRHPVTHEASRYVSDSHDIYHMHSRRVVMAGIDVPYIGRLNVFSVHLSWWEDGFQSQFRRLSEWAREEAVDAGATTLLCGDFNIPAGSAGYRDVVEAGHYEDQQLAVHSPDVFEGIFRVNDPHWRNYPGDDCRIDYIFMNKGGALRVTSARTLFTDRDYGRVSDHCGYLMTFEPR